MAARASEFADLLPECRDWSARPAAADLAGLPNRAAVMLLADGEDRPVQALTGQQLRRTLQVRLATPEDEASGPRADLGAIVRRVRWRAVDSPFEARRIHHLLLRRLEPRGYRKSLGFGRAWFVRADLGAPLPELQVSERVWCEPGAFAGPFPSQRAAQTAVDTLLDLFDLCRYPEQLRRAPRGQRCAYYDMGRCDAPCDGTASPEPFAARAAAAWRFLTGGDPDFAGRTEAAMHAAAREQAFERAALLKQQLAAGRRAQAEWAARVQDVAEWRQLLVVPVQRRKAWKPFLFDRGALADGEVIPQRRLVDELPAWVQAVAAGLEPTETDPTLRMEQSWLVAHFLGPRESDAAWIRRGAEGFGAAELRAWVEKRLAETARDAEAARVADDAEGSAPE